MESICRRRVANRIYALTLRSALTLQAATLNATFGRRTVTFGRVYQTLQPSHQGRCTDYYSIGLHRRGEA